MSQEKEAQIDNKRKNLIKRQVHLILVQIQYIKYKINFYKQQHNLFKKCEQNLHFHEIRYQNSRLNEVFCYQDCGNNDGNLQLVS
ncbi:unnamed protein product [Paramecium sonneborni]|uniref:Uncharacterized protein n=1 Tax=Paramecium sonneborni TaxID=65129 RepID=A0A8S1KC27_9CILI|nr:unnamed protein product [Paramecium sonneborni]